MSLRLGAVSFLNSRPLTVALEGHREDFALEYAVPSRCAADLHRGAVDVGLIPAIEYLRGPEPYCIVPNVAVGCRGPVLTVRLFFREEPGPVRRLALDSASRTSAVLARLLLKERYGSEPEEVEVGADLDRALQRADAALLIGDPVFSALEGNWVSLDLGQAWFEWTGLPFVFAFWAGRPGVLDAAGVQSLVEARRLGEGRRAAIAQAFAAANGGDADLYRRYLEEHIRFDLDAEAVEGLRLFYRLARENRLVDRVPRLEFYPAA